MICIYIHTLTSIYPFMYLYIYLSIKQGRAFVMQLLPPLSAYINLYSKLSIYF